MNSTSTTVRIGKESNMFSRFTLFVRILLAGLLLAGAGAANAQTVQIDSPLDGSTSATNSPITLTATATWDQTFNRVRYRVNGTLVSAGNATAPYTDTYTPTTAGSYTFVAEMLKLGVVKATSSPVTVTVTDGSGGGSGGGGGGSSPGSVTRTYVYDVNQRLCKTIDPESGATLVDYDAAGNIAWVAAGTTLTGNTCDRGSVTAAMKTSVRTYDALNRLTSNATPNGLADVSTTYTADGLVASLVAANGPAGTNPVTTTYTYDKRRLLSTESQPERAYTVNYYYDGNAHLSSLQYPDTQIVSYAPDAFGRATSVKAGTQTYASGITYFPNGAVSGFTYGNGVVHTLTQNTRQIPLQSRDAKGTNVVLDDTYAYDNDGNVTDITDRAQNGLTTRGMGYDGMDRMTAAVSPAQWGNATYTYDAIDNLRTANQGNRQFSYTYDTNNRLASISGSQSIAFVYDARGNVTSKGAQDFTFDPANRMTTAELLSGTGVQTYRYDGTGRRTQVTDPGSPGANTYWVYSKAGQLLYTHDERRGQNLAYIYLNDSQIATRSVNYVNGGAITISWQHTDALGSPVAETNASGVVTKRNSYAPYGEAYGSTSIDGTGYTGHVMDRDTGLTYMQQRYYDPTTGRFFSVDSVPVGTLAGENFGRYWYANDNPYRFTDPDGRCADGCILEAMAVGALVGAAVNTLVYVATEKSPNLKGLGVAAGTGAAVGAATAVLPVMAAAKWVTTTARIAPVLKTAVAGGTAVAIGSTGNAAKQYLNNPGHHIDRKEVFVSGVANTLGLGTGKLVSPWATKMATTVTPGVEAVTVKSLSGRVFSFGGVPAKTEVDVGVEHMLSESAGAAAEQGTEYAGSHSGSQ